MVAVEVGFVARRRPTAVALEPANGPPVTYEQLWERACGSAARFDLAAGELVGVRLGRGVAVVEAMLAVLVAGGVYVPFSPDDPPERTERLRARLGVRRMLGEGPSGELRIAEHDTGGRVLEVAGDPADRPVYVMWTSGSTGEPKCVVVPVRGVRRLINDRSPLGVRPDDRVAFVANPMFDATTWEVWATLGNGGTVVVFAPDDLRDVRRFRSRLEDTGITRMFLTTSMFNVLARRDPGMFGTLRTLAVGGEPLRPPEVRAVMESPSPPAEFVNGYGPTECTTFAVAHGVQNVEADAVRIPIGRPIDATSVVVVGADGRPLPDGTTGELWIGGDGVALGYLDDPVATAERFVDADLGGGTTRWYRTGDLAQRGTDGLLDCLGRLDRQIKVNGYRIEPMEVERAIETCDGVSTAVVLARRTTTSTSLIGFVVPSGGHVHPDSVMAEVCELLPGYMVPSRIVLIDRVPVTPNGKVDEDSLFSGLELAATSGEERSDGRGRGERTLGWFVADAIGSIVGRTDIGLDDDVWASGLDSLGAVELLSVLGERTGRSLRPDDLLRQPTADGIARLLRAEAPREGSEVVELNRAGTSAPMFIVPGGGATSLLLRDVAVAMGADRPLVVIESRGLYSGERPHRSIEAMAERVVGEVLGRRPVDPIVLAGWSGGAVVATHAAVELERRGHAVRLILLDTAFGRPRSPAERGVLGRIRSGVRRWAGDARHRAAQAVSFSRHRAVSEDRYREFTRIMVRAVHRYGRPPELTSPTAHFHVRGSSGAASVRAAIPAVSVFECEGDHVSMFDAANAAALVGQIDEWLSSTRSADPADVGG